METDNKQDNTTTTSQPETTQTLSSDSPISSVISGEARLYAKKFKTIDELEKAYGNAVGAMVKKSELEKELEKYKTVPDSYNLPNDIPFREEQFNEIKDFSKNAKLTQEQFEMAARNMWERANAQQSQVEERRKSIGDAKLTLLNEYVEKHYPTFAREAILDKLIKDDSAMNDAFKDREQKLNSQAPGMNSGHSGSGPEKFDGQKECEKLFREVERNPGDRNAVGKMFNVMREVAHERFKK